MLPPLPDRKGEIFVFLREEVCNVVGAVDDGGDVVLGQQLLCPEGRIKDKVCTYLESRLSFREMKTGFDLPVFLVISRQ